MRIYRYITAGVFLCGGFLFDWHELLAQAGSVASIGTQRLWVTGAIGASTSATLDLSQGVWYSPGPLLIGARRARSLVADNDWHESAVLLGLIARLGPVDLSAAAGRSTARLVYRVYSDQSSLVDSASGSGRAYSIAAAAHKGIIGAGVEVFGNSDGALVSRRGVALVIQLGVLEPWLHL
jgi:hypothetical protein